MKPFFLTLGCLIGLGCAAAVASDDLGADFKPSPHWGERIKTYIFDPDVRVHINAPGKETFDPQKPLRVVFFALPNGNTIEQTVGRRMEPGLDWHYDIQHIGAQTRWLRQKNPGENIVTVYLEAGRKSWPSWKRNHKGAQRRIVDLIRSVTESFAPQPAEVDLASHSGGGSFIFGYLDGVNRIPDSIKRIVFLDSNYGYSDDSGHGDKLIKWLDGRDDHFLMVIAYDDRNIMLNGKKVVGPTGGTFRATHRMLDRFSKGIELLKTDGEEVMTHRAFDGRARFLIHKNPENAILHTVLVEKNGFIHALTFGSTCEEGGPKFFGPRAYEDWIQPF